MRKIERWHSARLRHASQEGVAANLANEDADVYNVTDAAVKKDALAAALSLTALAADAVTAMPAPKKHPDDLRERATRLVVEACQRGGRDPADRRSARDPSGALCTWVKKAETAGSTPFCASTGCYPR